MAGIAAVARKPGRPKGGTDSKADILGASFEAFACYGFDGASVRQIAFSVRVSSAAVLHHYGSKRKLYAEVLHQCTPPRAPSRLGCGEPRGWDGASYST